MSVACFGRARGINLATAVVILLLGLLSIWFDDPTRLATGVGLVTAGLAFALQKVVTSIAGVLCHFARQYLQRRRSHYHGRCTWRCNLAQLYSNHKLWRWVNRLRCKRQTPAIWVKSRQYTGRIVTVTNDNIFDEPVYNYTRDFPYLWEEITIPITYTDKRDRAEQILLECARTPYHTDC